MSQQLFSSESVTEGHPDKVCDRISDAILDALLAADPHSRVAVETMAATGLIHIAGEVTTEAYVEIPEIVRREILSIGYDSSRVGFDGASCGVSVSLDGQSPDIAGGVDEALEVRGTQGGDPRDRLGAGDQGIMFGYASSDTPDLMPAPIWLAHRLAKRLTDVRKQSIVEGLRPDGKTQVTLAYEDGRPVGIDTVVVSTQHDEALSQSAIADAARHGGGAFSGKDPSKVDRSATYAARWVAKNVVAAGIAQRCEIQLAYAIGRARPIGLYVDTFGTASVPDERIADAIREVFDLRPLGMIEDLDLLRPIYRDTAAYGHFGRDQFPWEAINRVDQLKAALA